MIRMFNLMKKKQVYPSIFQPSNISSFYKKKGDKSDLNNDRGVFNVVKVRSILDKLATLVPGATGTSVIISLSSLAYLMTSSRTRITLLV